MREIQLSQGQVAQVDDEDYERLSAFRWNYRKSTSNTYGYARRSNGKQEIHMHREVLRCGDQDVDHINHNGLDNRKENLRLVTTSQNAMNQRKWAKPCSSRFKGVSWHKRAGKWIAYIKLNQKQVLLGSFLSEQEVALAYNQAATRMFGEFCFLNRILDPDNVFKTCDNPINGLSG